MKPIAIISIFLLAITFASCTKDAGPVGKKEITGTVSVKQGSTTAAAEGALVYITYGTTEASTTYDAVTATDASGKYSLDGLAKGDYFITAQYTDANGFVYTTPGFGVTVNDAKNSLTLDMTLE